MKVDGSCLEVAVSAVAAGSWRVGRLMIDPEVRLRKLNQRDSCSAEGTRAENQVERNKDMEVESRMLVWRRHQCMQEV